MNIRIVKSLVKSVPHFPKEGINFLDISPILNDHEAYQFVVDQMTAECKKAGVTKVGAFDSRGFLFGPMIAQALKVPFFMIRKAGKLPGKVVGEGYGLEYGEDKVEIQVSAVSVSDRVALIDDVLATGGTMRAGCNLVEKLGGKVALCNVMIELPVLSGRVVLQKYNVQALMKL